MKTRRLTLAAAPVVLGAMLVAGCGGGSDSGSDSAAGGSDCTPKHSDVQTITKGTLTASVYVSEPYTKLDRAGGELGGVDGELLKKIAAMECLDLKASPVAGAAVIQSVQSKRADVAIGGIYRTADRAKILELSGTMYRDGMAILSKDGLSDLAGLKGRKVGVIQGYLWNAELQKALGSDNVKVYQDSTSMISDMNAGRVDAGILTSAEAAFRAKDGLQAEQFAADPSIPSSTKPGEVVIPSVKGNTTFATALSADIDSLVKDGTVAGVLKANGMDESLAGPGTAS